jgi:hypothetical protein
MNTKYIFESPDRGQTIYRSVLGDFKQPKELIRGNGMATIPHSIPPTLYRHLNKTNIVETNYIYESPDGGKTIYKRRRGDLDGTREVVHIL